MSNGPCQGQPLEHSQRDGSAPGGDGEPQRKFFARKDHALAVIVLAVEPSLLYLLGDPKLRGRSWRNNFSARHGQISCS